VRPVPELRRGQGQWPRSNLHIHTRDEVLLAQQNRRILRAIRIGFARLTQGQVEFSRESFRLRGPLGRQFGLVGIVRLLSPPANLVQHLAFMDAHGLLLAILDGDHFLEPLFDLRVRADFLRPTHWQSLHLGIGGREAFFEAAEADVVRVVLAKDRHVALGRGLVFQAHARVAGVDE